MILDTLLKWPWPRARPRLIRQARAENCVQTVIAMILGVEVESIERAVRTTGTMTLEQVMDMLQQLKLSARPLEGSLAAGFWSLFYERHGRARLRGLGMRLPSEEGIGHAVLVYGSRIYDPATGMSVKLTSDTLESLDWILLLSVDSVNMLGTDLRPGIEKLRPF